ncbi:MAG: DUF2807 domain-containing protein [Marinifilaceae bacterium]|jgi:hypothetical protein|nr:DUF2807 domain-containing protein [Marinifilaceae bacterium]
MKYSKFKIWNLFLIVLCFSINTACGQISGKTGNGNVISQKREISNFENIRASAGLNVYLKQGDKEELSVEADENIIDLIETKVESNTLILSVKNRIRKSTKRDIYVTIKNLESLKISSGVDLKSLDYLKLGDISIAVSSGADLDLKLDAKSTNIKVSSGADADIKGSTESLIATTSSGSDLNCMEFESKTVEAKASSGSDIYVYVTESITARASSGADIKYKGAPKEKNIHKSSGGSIRQK